MKTCKDCARKNRCMDRSRNYLCAHGFTEKEEVTEEHEGLENNEDQGEVSGQGMDEEGHKKWKAIPW